MAEVPEFSSDENRDIVTEIMEAHGYDELTGTQAQAFSEGVLDEDNSLLIAETGNGKTMVAESVLKKSIDSGGDAVYLVPSYQLTQAKKSELEEWADFDVGLGTRAIRSPGVPVMTFESFFQAVMRNIGDVRSVDRAIFDDFHEIYSYHRGAGIEKAMTACLDNDIDVFAMSATVGNPRELANWLNAELIISESDRSIPVIEQPIDDDPGQTRGAQIAEIINEREEKAPFLVFNNRRDWSESRGEDIADTKLFEDANDRDFYSEIESALPAEMTVKYEKLAEMMEKGVAFHHSGLDSKVRDIIVDAVQEGDLMCVSATPGLAYGFDAPIQAVIIADTKRYGDFIGVYEYIQWVGRAGRPGYGYDEGYAFPIVKDERANDYFQFGVPAKDKRLEDVKTHIESDPEFRQLLLELIDFGWDTPEEIERFLSHSLFWEQYDSTGAWGRDSGIARDQVERKLRTTVNWLERRQLVSEQRTSGTFETSSLGEAAIEFNYATWIKTRLESITSVANELQYVIDDPLSLVETLTREFDSATLRSTPNSSDFESKLYEHGLTRDDSGKTSAMLCWHWCQGDSLDRLEKEYDTDMADVPNAGRDVADLLEASRHLAEVDPSTRIPEWYDTFTSQLRYGVTAEDIYLAEQVDQLGRGRISTIKSHFKQSPGVDSTKPLPDQLRTLLEENDRQRLEDTLRGISGIGSTLAGRITDAIVDWNGTAGMAIPPFTKQEKDSTGGDGFTRASSLDEFGNNN